MTRKILSGVLLAAALLVAVLSPKIFIGHAQSSHTDWWPMLGHDLNHTGYSTSKAPRTNTTIWTQTIPVDYSSFASPVVVDGMVFIGSSNKKVYALNASTGQKIWNFTTQGEVRATPAVANGRVYIGSVDGKLYALNASTGQYIWAWAAGHPIESSPAVATVPSIGTVIFVGSFNGSVYAIEDKGSYPNLQWHFPVTGYYIRESSPAVATVYDDPDISYQAVFIGATRANDSRISKVFALNASNGAHIWSHTYGYFMIASPVVAYDPIKGDYLVITGSDMCPIALYACNGTSWAWRRGDINEVWDSVAVYKGLVYVRSGGSKVPPIFYALNLSTGEDVWSLDIFVLTPPSVADGMVFCGTYDGKVYALDADDGSIVWTYQAGDFFECNPAIADGRLYMNSCDNKLYAFEDPPSYTLTITATTNGTTDPTAGNYSYYEGTKVNVTAIPDEGYRLDHWELDDVNVGTDNPYQVTMDCNHTLQAFFEVGVHDVAVTDVLVNYGATIVHGGRVPPINVTVENEGDSTETFNVTVYWNTTEIDTKQINVSRKDSAELTFYWNTSGLPEYLYYNITAYAHPVADETDLLDNTFVYGNVEIAHEGDVNADGKVRIDDILAIAGASGSDYGDPEYDGNLDITCDGKIRIDDVLAAAANFGWP